jgi:hypothetical protein
LIVWYRGVPQYTTKQKFHIVQNHCILFWTWPLKTSHSFVLHIPRNYTFRSRNLGPKNTEIPLYRSDPNHEIWKYTTKQKKKENPKKKLLNLSTSHVKSFMGTTSHACKKNEWIFNDSHLRGFKKNFLNGIFALFEGFFPENFWNFWQRWRPVFEPEQAWHEIQKIRSKFSTKKLLNFAKFNSFHKSYFKPNDQFPSRATKIKIPNDSVGDPIQFSTDECV